ncbi:MaoC family dehydratase [Streptomonospora nanhaiensis]|uniref:Acyl dehydratase n=1 Tax=Streptomonospora nanhaiensis TaxID=1323731 RepID=A0A853BKH2_9ACTN|nr:MaoC family dehydratase [Streptomonospora nanhaiensis]MBV2362319.1 MaoC family dehydratase [Streptomonospora nanhaiensis]MBX9388205.1 MaoC family dehydratase [Streptomonospora nanhaiensis]NYI95026.1 acyl dehydratase [Streptomonospora nanhaiensis]
MRIFTDLAELVAAKGEHLGYSDWLTVTQDRIDRFADATDDHQWIHVDRERAANGPFGGTIAHGFLTLSLLSAFSPQVWTLRQRPSMAINYGLNRVRFLQPVRTGSRVRDGIELIDTRETKNGLLLTFGHTVEIEGEERAALVAEGLSLMVP